MPGVCRSIPVWHAIKLPTNCGTQPNDPTRALTSLVGKAGGELASVAVNFTFSLLQRSPERQNYSSPEHHS